MAAKVDLGPVYQDARLAVAGTLPGIFFSSGRAELAGAIVGLLSRDFVTLKADNRGNMDKTLKYMQLGTSGRKHWPLHHDGDLWELLFSVGKARGFNAFTNHWCKGHVTLQFLQEGKGQACDAIMNSLADLAADKAYRVPSNSAAHASRCAI